MKRDSLTIDLIAKECIAGRLRILNRVVTNLYDNALRPFGLKISQGNILIVTGKMGVANPEQVCDYLQLDISTLSRNVELMRKKGWLETVAGKDARHHPFRLTAKGRTLIEKALPAWEKAQASAKEILGEKLVTMIGDTARKLSATKSE